MRTYSWQRLLGLLVLGMVLSTSCGKKDNQEGDQQQGGCGGGCCGPNCGGGGSGISAVKATADLTGAFGLLAVDSDGSTSLALVKEHNDVVDRLNLAAPKFIVDQEGIALSEISGGKERFNLNGRLFSFPRQEIGFGLTADDPFKTVMQKIDSSTKEIKDALKQTPPSNNAYDPNIKLPKILTIAVSPTKDVYLHFERSFIYKDAEQKDDPWNPSNGFQCQIFKVAGGTLDDLLTSAPSRENLECIDNTHFIDSWRKFANGTFQFDSDGNIYYPGGIPNVQGMVVYKRARDGSSVAEIINAKICVQNFLITKAGGAFYTGQTCSTDTGGGGGGGGGFFRYVAPGKNGQIIEIARDWWNFIFDTAVTDDNTDTAVFFGPDPRNASTASWSTACLFNFDPSKSEPSERISEVITCGNDIWDWMQMRRSVDVTAYGTGYDNWTGGTRTYPSLAWKKEFKRRCESTDEVFAGGGSQITAIKQDSEGDIYVIGNIRKKQEGNTSCSIEFRGPHCVISSLPVLKNSSGTAYTSTSCLAASGTWISKGRCSTGSTDASCIVHSRSWTAGFCSNPDYTTKASCEAKTGCWDNWNQSQSSCQTAGYTWGAFVWQTGRCNNFDQYYKTKTTCEAAGKTWQADDWAGECSSTDSADNAKLYNNDKRGCIPEWQTETVWYDNVDNDLCVTTETGDRDTWYNWDSKANNFAQTASSTRSAYSSLDGKFLINRMDCKQANSTNNDWTKEYSALAKVDKDAKTLRLLSLESEKAINLWLVNDKPYYSSFDTTLGKYLLNGLTEDDICIDTAKSESGCTGTGFSWSERRCLATSYSTESTCEDQGYLWTSVSPHTVISNFETYNLADSGSDDSMFADGLDFNTNAYKFGTIDVANKTLSLKTGLTGTVKTIVILPKK